jgi:hypothetical protein
MPLTQLGDIAFPEVSCVLQRLHRSHTVQERSWVPVSDSLMSRPVPSSSL